MKYEAYDLGRNQDGRRNCTIRYAIRSVDSELDPGLVHPLTYDMRIDEPVKKYDGIMPRLGSLNVDLLPAGVYELVVEIEDEVTGRAGARQVQFRKIWPASRRPEHDRPEHGRPEQRRPGYHRSVHGWRQYRQLRPRRPRRDPPPGRQSSGAVSPRRS